MMVMAQLSTLIWVVGLLNSLSQSVIKIHTMTSPVLVSTLLECYVDKVSDESHVI